ncbi:uncharacterized protein LOC142345062 [Convolutriloba macropyga]|uniref:uncharacterized protein LOC142345062 n=1 Tax=Convolutriloba macropyga TaxID=536237 RepID=UPI003F52470E
MLFTEFSRVKKVASSFVYILSTHELTIEYKLAYFKMAVQFLTLQSNVLSLRDNLVQDLNKIDQNLNQLLEIDYDKRLSLNHEELDLFLKGFKNFYSSVKKAYMIVSATQRADCEQKMKKLEETIADRIEDVQRGKTCDRGREVYHVRDDLNEYPVGFGSMMHRICECISLAIQRNQTCLIDDSVFSYDRGNINYYFTSLQQCPTAYRVKRIPFLDGKKRPPHLFRFGLRHIPPTVKKQLQYCVEDAQAWYVGVLLKHMFKESFFLFNFLMHDEYTNKISKFFNVVKLN